MLGSPRAATRRVEPEPAAILLGVDHEHSTGADHQMVDVGLATGDGQVVQDRPPVPLQRREQPSGTPLPHRTAPPGDDLRAGPKPQPQPATDPKKGGDPPGQGPDPGRPLGHPQPPPPGLGGAARPTVARTRTATTGRSASVPASSSSGSLVRWAQMASRSAGLSGRAERPHRPAGPVLVVEGPGSRTGHRVLPFSGVSRRLAPGRAGHAGREVAAAGCVR
jgi:hypothetical protein